MLVRDDAEWALRTDLVGQLLSESVVHRFDKDGVNLRELARIVSVGIVRAGRLGGFAKGRRLLIGWRTERRRLLFLADQDSTGDKHQARPYPAALHGAPHSRTCR